VESQLVLHGVLLPAAFAFALVVAFARRRERWMGVSLLLAFAISVSRLDPIVAQPRQGAWTTVVLCLGLMVGIATIANDRGGSRVGRGVACAIAGCAGALMLTMPEWIAAERRLVLASALAASSALLLPPGMHRGGFSFWCAQSLALAGVSVLALSSGFAKLAIPVGAASALCGWIGVLALFTKPHRSLHAGMSGSVAIAGIAGLASATTFAFDTGGLPVSACALAAISPLGCWLGELPPFRASRVASGLARILGCAVISGLVALIALRASARDEADAYALMHAHTALPIDVASAWVR
jgi:hypothetical protein